MLIKCLKHDFIGIYRDFFGLLIAIVLAAAMMVGALLLPENVFTAFLPIISAILIIGVGIVSFLTVFRLYYKRIYTNEGYLTMALPVKSYQLVLSKLLTACAFSLLVLLSLSVVIAVSLLIVLFATGGTVNFAPLWSFLQRALREPMGYAVILMLLMSFVSSVLTLYLATSVAHLRALRKLKLLAGIAVLYGVSFIESLLTFGAAFLFAKDLFFSPLESSDLQFISATVTPIFSIMAAVLLITAVLKFFGCAYFLSHQLEME